ncbi:Uncharacterized protein Adt_46183 [Abeliophyllum distichum]|uniref:Peptidase A2 domain-containing protein n=1 Tax=Abeliophyllum distichum TaxID=126358 RepID=A0ABD1P1Y9_9LAMI
MSSVVIVLLNGLRNHTFRASLSKKPPKSMTELLRRGEEYIDQEEVMKATKTDRDIYDGGIRKRRQEEVLTNRLSNRRITDHRYRAMVRPINSIGVFSIFGQSITYIDRDLEGALFSHDDVLVITCDITDIDVKRVLVDTGSAVNVLNCKAFEALKMPIDRLKIINTPLQGFGGETVIPEGVIDLPVVLGKHHYYVTIITPFLLVRTPMAYNSIYGRTIINSVGAMISTQHQAIIFSTSRGIGVIKGDQLISRRCYVDSIQVNSSPMVLNIEKEDIQQVHRFEPTEEVENVEVKKTIRS